MKKIFFLTVLFVLAPTINTTDAASFAIRAVNDDDITTDTFLVEDDVYASGRCSGAADKYSHLYVVTEQNRWQDDDHLDDISGGFETLQFDEDGRIDFESVWHSRLDIGEYQLIVDVNQDGAFDEGTDCASSPFQVILRGYGEVREGSRSPEPEEDDETTFLWSTESETPFVTMLQMRVSADDLEDLTELSFELDASGSGHDTNNIAEIYIALDAGNDGEYTHGRDALIGRGGYNHNNGSVTIETSWTLEKGKTEHLIVVYVMGDELEDEETFVTRLEGIDAKGALSGKAVSFKGTPIQSSALEIDGDGDAPEIEKIDTKEESEKEGGGGGDQIISETPQSNNNLLTGFFSNNDSQEDREESGPPPIGLRVALFILVTFLVLLVLWRIIRRLFWFISDIFT